MAMRTDDVMREELLRRLPEAGGVERLLVMAAPGGWGKTTLLGTWEGWATDTSFCRFSLTPPDNDPTRFISGLLTAAEPLLGNREKRWPDPGASTPTVWVEDNLPLFADAIEAESPAILVLDDYNVIENAETHGIVQSLVDTTGPHTLTVLSTRVDPPLRLARHRAARAVTDVRAEDLRFSVADTDLLLRQAFDLELTLEQLQLLVAKTEGWPAAISLAAQSLRTVSDPDEFLSRFIGSDRLIVDYLAEELLDTLPPSHREFLQHTSVVEQFVPSLSAVLTGQENAGQIGEDLERGGLIRRNYEADRMWYRYHQLLRDVLYQHLDPAMRRNKHAVAADWFLADSQPRVAIEQLIAAGEVDRAAALIGEHAGHYLLRGRYRTVEKWIAAVHDQAGAAPGLLLLGAQAALYGGEVERARMWLARAEAVDAELLPGERLLALSTEAALASAAGRTDDAVTVAEQLIEHYETNDDLELAPSMAAEAIFVAALQFGFGDQIERAERCIDLSIALCSGGSNQIPAVAGYGLKALYAYTAGDDGLAVSLTDRAGAIAAELNLPPTSLHMGPLQLMRVLVGCDSDASEAVDHLRKLCEYLYIPSGVALGQIGEASYRLGIDDVDGAEVTLVAGRDILDELEQPSALLERYYALIQSQLPDPTTDEEPAGIEALTDRELQVLRAFSSNLTQREIGRELFLSFNTIKTYARSAYRKLGVSSRSEAVKACREAGLF